MSALFSATFPESVQRVARDFLNDNYVFVTIGMVGGACKDVEQTFEDVPKKEKRTRLIEILSPHKDDPDLKVLIFCASKKGADFLAGYLGGEDYSVTSIHGDRLQSQREQALRDFSTGNKKILVATAVAARGLGNTI